MKILFLIIIIVLSFSQVIFAQGEKPANIKSFYAKNENAAKIKASGIEIMTYYETKNGKKMMLENRYYDIKGKITYINTNFNNTDVSFREGAFYGIQYVYDSSGNMTDEIYIEKGKFTRKWRYLFDSLGRLKKQLYYYPCDTLNFTYTYHYDDKSNVIGYELTTPDNRSYDVYKCTYDSYNNVIKLAYDISQRDGYKRRDSLTYAYVYEMPAGRIVKKVSAYSGLTQSEEEFGYDDKGRMIFWHTIRMGNHDTTTYQYDAKDNLVIEENRGFQKYIITYEYDENSNLLKKISRSKDPALDYTMEYLYEYYGK